MNVWQDIADKISARTGRPFRPKQPDSLGGGCINAAFRLGDGVETWFVKTNSGGALDMFKAEAAGLDALAASATFRVPRVLCNGDVGGVSYIVMQYLDLGRAGKAGWVEAGHQLAAMHHCTAKAFGWDRDNTVGATPQQNAWQPDWISFWREERLGFQLELAARNGYGDRLQSLGERLLGCFSVLIDHDPRPSLLHGDLWGGNLGFTRQGEPAIYDPAVYYGDREAELAMTELFGGFSADFYAAYREAWPIDSGYRVRRDLYNLYHILNHLNLFGGGYGAQAERMMQGLLAQC